MPDEIAEIKRQIDRLCEGGTHNAQAGLLVIQEVKEINGRLDALERRLAYLEEWTPKPEEEEKSDDKR